MDPLFSVSAVFAVIIIHDSVRLRGEVQKHAKLLNLVLKELPDDHPRKLTPLSEMIGHSPMEALAGFLFGCFYAFMFSIFQPEFQAITRIVRTYIISG